MASRAAAELLRVPGRPGGQRRSFCDANWHASLLFRPRLQYAAAACGLVARDLPYVSRAAYQKGEDVEFGFTRCWVHFARQGDAWAVARSECSDEPMD
jgi:hypothetical protein